MQLVPETVTCPSHPAQDLSGLVRTQLLADPDVVANTFLGPRRRRPGLQRYVVIVTCPGDGAPHQQDVDGSWQP